MSTRKGGGLLQLAGGTWRLEREAFKRLLLHVHDGLPDPQEHFWLVLIRELQYDFFQM